MNTVHLKHYFHCQTGGGKENLQKQHFFLKFGCQLSLQLHEPYALLFFKQIRSQSDLFNALMSIQIIYRQMIELNF